MTKRDSWTTGRPVRWRFREFSLLTATLGTLLVAAALLFPRHRWPGFTSDRIDFDPVRHGPPVVALPSDDEIRQLCEEFVAAVNARDEDAIESLCDLAVMADRVTFGFPPQSPLRRREGQRVRRHLRQAIRSLATNHGGRTRASFLKVHQRAGQRGGLVRLHNEKTALSYFDLVVGRNSLGQPVLVDYYSISEGVSASELYRTLFLAKVGEEHQPIAAQLPKAIRPFVGYSQEVRQLLSRQPPLPPEQYWDAYRQLPDSVRDWPPLQTRALWAVRQLGRDADYDRVMARVRRLCRDRTRLQLLLLDYWATRGRHDDVLQTIDELDHLVGGDPFLYVLRAQTRLLQRQYQATLSDATLAASKMPDAEYAYWLIFQAAYQLKRNGQAVDALRTLAHRFGVDVRQLESASSYPDLAFMSEYQELLREIAGE